MKEIVTDELKVRIYELFEKHDKIVEEQDEYIEQLRERNKRLQSENTRLKALADNQCDDCACEIANERDRLKTENDELFYKLSGVMLSVNKWLDGEELNQDEVNRACTMREKTLQITERLTAERDKAVEEVERLKARVEHLEFCYE